MSAWIVSKDHIDLIITAALGWEHEVPEHADERGRMLWLENVASVAHRYPNDKNGNRPGGGDTDEEIAAYTFEPYCEGRMDPQVVAGACQSLEYQSCQHRRWEKSQARAWLMPLIEIAEGLVPEYIARFGPVDVGAQAPGQRDWQLTRFPDGTDAIMGGWSVGDRELLLRTEKLRTVAVVAS